MMRVRTNLEAIPTIFLTQQMEEEEVTGLMHQLASSWEVTLDCSWCLVAGPVYVPANIRRSINLPQLSITLNTMFIELFDHKYWDKMYFIERFKGAKGAAFRKQRINGEYCNKRRIKWVYVLVYSSYETLLWWRIQNRKHLHSKPKRSTSSPSRKTLKKIKSPLAKFPLWLLFYEDKLFYNLI